MSFTNCSKIIRCGLVMSVMLFILVLPIVNAQAEKVHDEGDSTKRPNYVLLRAIFAGQSAVYAGSIYGLSKSWYKDLDIPVKVLQCSWAKDAVNSCANYTT